MVESEPPKLFAHKPKRVTTVSVLLQAAQIKKSQGNVAKDFSLQRASATPPPLSSTPPAAPVKESFARRYKYLWPTLLTVNLAYGAYLYIRVKKKDASGEEETAAAVAVSAPDSVSRTAHPVSETTAPSIAVSAPTVSTQASALPIQTTVSPAMSTPQTTGGIVPEEQQRELFQWILDEKRKLKPVDAAEKKRIDVEKAVLKQFIRAQSIPSV